MPDEPNVSGLSDRKRDSRPPGRRDWPDREIGHLAGRQHGVVGRRQLRQLGLTDSRIESRLRRGNLLQVHRGVYAVGRPGLTAEGRWMAAVLAAGSGAVLSHRSAGQIWRLIPRTDGWPEVTKPTRLHIRVGISAHMSTFGVDEVGAVDGIPVTGVSRTIFDLAAVLSKGRLERAMNEAEVLGLTDRVSLPEMLDRYPRRRGSAALRALLHEPGRGVPHNEMESLFAALVERYDLPPPRRNADVAAKGRFFSVDCIWRDQRLIVELDGRAVHGTRRAFESDRERDRLLIAAGWRVMRLTWRQLRDQRGEIAADLLRALTL